MTLYLGGGRLKPLSNKVILILVFSYKTDNISLQFYLSD